MTWEYDRAENGNVAMTGEIDLLAVAGRLCAGARLRQRARIRRRETPSPACSDGFDQATARTTSPAGRDGSGPTAHRRIRPSVPTICPTSASPCCAPTSPRRCPAASSPACPSRGDSARATMIWAATISSGRATWWRRQAACSPPARTRTPAAHWLICRPRNRRTDTGRRTCGWMARPIGTESRWTRRRCRSCWWIWLGARRR